MILARLMGSPVPGTEPDQGLDVTARSEQAIAEFRRHCYIKESVHEWTLHTDYSDSIIQMRVVVTFTTGNPAAIGLDCTTV